MHLHISWVICSTLLIDMYPVRPLVRSPFSVHGCGYSQRGGRVEQGIRRTECALVDREVGQVTNVFANEQLVINLSVIIIRRL